MAYEQCIDVSEEIWKDFAAGEPREIAGRTGALYQGEEYHVPFLDRTLLLSPVRRQVQVAGAPGVEPGFRLCLTALLYLLHLNPAALGPGISPLELPGGATFFRGPPRFARRHTGRAFRTGRGQFFGRRKETARRGQTWRRRRGGAGGLPRSGGRGNRMAGGRRVPCPGFVYRAGSPGPVLVPGYGLGLVKPVDPGIAPRRGWVIILILLKNRQIRDIILLIIDSLQ
jgi:hypothetical protein